MTQSVLQGNSIPITNSPCGTAYVDLFTVNDGCARSVQSLVSGNESAMRDLFYGDCPSRLYNYFTACSTEEDNNDDEVRK